MADDLVNQIDMDLPVHQGTTESVSYAEPENGSNDVHSASNSCGWGDFLLNDDVFRAINDCGFEHPSEVQYKAIPITRIGSDAIIQAKSGMGKTAVYAISILHQNPAPSDKVESIIVVHTHELAVQVANEFRRFAKYLPNVRVAEFYGGGAKEDDNIATLLKVRPNVVVGTPGRLLSLIKRKVLDLDAVRFFVVDECDILLEKYRADIQGIFLATPRTKQVMMLSATIDEKVRAVCRSFMREPKEIIINEFRVLSLDYVVQYFDEVDYNSKTRRLTELLDDIEFNQVIIFVNASNNAKKLCRVLNANNFPAIVACTSMPQSERSEAYRKFKEAQARILVSTDIMGRGVDFANVNVVINYDLPTEVDSYLHRIGRAGRFGTKGIGITLVASKEDGEQLNKIQERFSTKIQKYDGKVDPAVYKI